MDVSQYNLLDEFRIPGHWWLPSNPGDRVAGSLSVSPEGGVRLELTGLFSSPDFDPARVFSNRQPIRSDLVLGEDADGDVYTLYKVDALHISTTSTLRVSYLLAGRHFPSVEEIGFRSALVQYSHLEAWSCFQFTRPTKSASPDFFSIEIPTNRVPLFRTNATGPIKELSLRAHALSRFTLSTVEIKPSAHFWIDLHAAADLKTFFALSDDLGQLMTMLVGEPSYVKKLRLFDSGDAGVDLFFPSTIRRQDELHSPLMCFPLRDIINVVQALTEQWFGSLTLLGPVYDLLFGTLFGRESFVQSKFLSLTQALESFHRRTAGGTYMPTDDFLPVKDSLIAAVPASVPDSLRRRLSDTIKYANDYSLRKRLKELLSGLDGSTVEMLKISDIAGMAELVVKSRNYLTHFDEESEAGLANDIVGMHYMNERLTALLFILILKRLGMDEATAARGTLKRRFFQ